MIIREQADTFIMIEQHHHANISGELYEQVATKFSLENNLLHNSIGHAIYNHDVGWAPFDAAPFWDDVKKEPYSFITYPNTIKTVIYRSGIDQVAAVNLYAALLCSEHYIRFLANDSSPLSKDFIQYEHNRQADIKKTLAQYDADTFSTHYELLQFFDNLSLFLCLHNLDASSQHTHPFFKKGMTMPTLYGGGTLQARQGRNEVVLDKDIFKDLVDIDLIQRNVSKKHIQKVGLFEAWENTPVETVQITIRN